MTWQDYMLILAGIGGAAGVVKMIVSIPSWWEARKNRKLQEKQMEEK